MGIGKKSWFDLSSEKYIKILEEKRKGTGKRLFLKSRRKKEMDKQIKLLACFDPHN